MSDSERLQAIIKTYKLNTPLAVIGLVIGAFSAMVIPFTIVAITHKVALHPPTFVNKIVDAGLGFMFNRWFWVSLLLASILGLVFSAWSCYESQFRRKLMSAVMSAIKAEYKKTDTWPWE